MNDIAEARAILARADIVDLERIAASLDRWPRRRELEAARMETWARPSARPALEDAIANALVDAATPEIARATDAVKRALRRREESRLHRAVSGAARRLGVRVPTVGTLEGRLAALALAVIDRALLAMSPEDQQALLSQASERLDPGATGGGLRSIAKASALPVVHHALGSAALVKVMEGVLAQAAAAFFGREAARHAFRAAIARAPWAAAALGPAAWAGSSAWLLYEAQGPAYRKLVPALLALGLVAARRT
ncbi:MAG: hypothetical protein KF819_05660 [Labilithrix sp.]|nr:hypothetical protein [Labilithrix sp.]